MTLRPIFSIIIPAYNAADTITNTLNAVLAQTVKDFEIIIINDGSTDDTLSMIEPFLSDRIRVISTPNGGVSRARNLGINKAQGKYIALLDADDYWAPQHLEYAQHFLDVNPDINWYANRISRVSKIPQNTQLGSDAANYTITNFFKDGYCIVHSSSVVFRRGTGESNNIFPEHLSMGEDMIAWARYAALNEKIGINNHTLVYYLSREESAVSKISDRSERYYVQDCDERILDTLSELVLQYNTPALRKFFRKQALTRWTASTGRLSMSVYNRPLRRYRRQQGFAINASLFLAHVFQRIFLLCVHLPMSYLHQMTHKH